VTIEMFGPWRSPDGASPARPSAVLSPLPLFLCLLEAVVAWRNMRAGRGDRRGALRIAVVFFS
jgi:hypothetical protein